MAYLKAAIAMTLCAYTSRSFFQMGWFVVARFLLTSALRVARSLCNSRAYFKKKNPHTSSCVGNAVSFIRSRTALLVMRRCQVSLLVKRYFCCGWCIHTDWRQHMALNGSRDLSHDKRLTRLHTTAAVTFTRPSRRFVASVKQSAQFKIK